MTFLVIFVAMLVERFFDWSHLRHWRWFDLYQRAIIKRLNIQSSYLLLAINILPLLLLTAIIQFSLKGLLFGFLSLVFQILLVLYCFGPQNLWADAFACINAMNESDAKSAAKKFAMAFGVSEKKFSHQRLIDKIFIASNSRIFAIIFWFVVLGPIGVVFYRTISLTVPQSPYHHANPALVPSAKTVLKLLDWLPVRVLTFLFALGGHFVQVLDLWRKQVFSFAGFTNGGDNDSLVMECGIAALGTEEIEQAVNDGSLEKNAISLLDRVFVIVLVLMAVAALMI